MDFAFLSLTLLMFSLTHVCAPNFVKFVFDKSSSLNPGFANGFLSLAVHWFDFYVAMLNFAIIYFYFPSYKTIVSKNSIAGLADVVLDLTNVYFKGNSYV